MVLSPSVSRPICFLSLFLVLCRANVVSRTKSSPTQENAEVSGTMELDNKPVAVSDELMYKSGTDERLSAAEKAFGGGNNKYASKEEELKDIYEFNTFYNPNKWEQMLDDADYEELDQEMRRIKSARWKTKKADQEELDVEEEESDHVDSSQEFDDEDYQAMDVPAVQVQLDAQSQEIAQRHSQEMGQANEAALNEEERSAQTAEKLASWMDIVGGDPEFTRQDEEADKDKNAASFDLYNMFSSNRPEEKAEVAGQVVVEEETKEVDLLGVDEDVEEDKEKVRRKRSYQSFDDDYSSALAFDGEGENDEKTRKKDMRAGNAQLDDDDEELIENERTFDEDDYATSEGNVKEEEKQDIVEEEDADVRLDDKEALDTAAKKEIDKEYDDVTVEEQKGMAASAQSPLVHQDEEDRTKRYRTKVKDRKGRNRVKNTQVRDVRHRYELNDPDADSTRWLQVRHRRKDQWMEPPPRHHRTRHNFDQDDRTVAVSLGDHHQRTRHYHPQLTRKQKLENQQRYDDRRYDDDDGDDTRNADLRSRRTSHHARQPSTITNKATYDRHERRDRTPRHSSEESIRRKVRSDVGNHEFSWDNFQQYDKEFAKGRNLDTDDDYEMDVGDGSIESRYADVCNKVREEFREPRSGGLDGQSHPGVKFSGAFKKGEGQCDIFCERTEGANSVYVLFHLKDWPCGPDKKGRCSLDGKCEETSREKKR